VEGLGRAARSRAALEGDNMKKLSSIRSAAVFVAALAAAALLAAAVGCQDSLAIKDKVVADVEKATAPKNPGIHISVLGGEVHSGDTVTFPASIKSLPGPSMTFTIENVGDRALTLLGSPIVATQGANPGSFGTTQPAGTVGPNSSTSFVVTFSPGVAGSFTANIIIASDDPTYSSFQINLAGNGTEWHGVQAVMSSGDVGQYSSLGLNGSIVYIGYRNETNDRLNVIRSTGSGLPSSWGASAAVPDTVNSGLDTSLAVYGSDVYIAYAASPVLLSLPRFVKGTSGTSWGSPSDLDASNGGSRTSIWVDGGTIYEAYGNSSGLQVKTSTNGTSWSNAPDIDSCGFHPTIGGAVSIGAASPNIYVAYYSGSSSFGIANHNTLNEPSAHLWMSDSPETTTGAGYYNSMVTLGIYAYVAYYVSSTGDLKFVRAGRGGTVDNTAITFSTVRTVESAGNVGQYCSIASADGAVFYISYYDATNADLKVAKSINSGTSWTLQTVDSSGDVGKYTSIKVVPGATTSADIVYVSYYDATNGDLKLAKSLDGGATW
jgi:hypothetical protein